LSAADFDKVFEAGYELVKEMPWLAYPKYRENIDLKQIPDIVLDEESRRRVYYLNAMEWSASCMEISCISARNVSLLIAGKEGRLVDDRKAHRVLSSQFLSEESTPHRSLLRKMCLVSGLLLIFAFLVSFFMQKF
jgi:hypothetical protein